MMYCHDCADPATGTWDEPTGPNTVQTIPVCYPCWYARDSYDPTPWDQESVTSGVSAREMADPTHPANREAWEIKRGGLR